MREKGAQCFRDLYFEASRIHLLWNPLLAYLANRRNVIGVIATDHYAEITAHLEGQLREMGLRGYPLKKGPPLSEDFLGIASSADLGFSKDQEGFWKTLRESLPLFLPQHLSGGGFRGERTRRGYLRKFPAGSGKAAANYGVSAKHFLPIPGNIRLRSCRTHTGKMSQSSFGNTKSGFRI